jgi:hypothetical protein
MSLERSAMPSSRMRAPSLISGKISRSKISLRSIGRRLMPWRTDASTISRSVSASGSGERDPPS